jgi:hypothetical protein
MNLCWGAERTLDEVQREFPGWTVSRGTDSMFHAVPRDGTPGKHVRGEDPADLRDEIIREIWHATGQPPER